jgi:hypothetical protein
MKMTPLQASNLKQEDNLRPQKNVPYGERYGNKIFGIPSNFKYYSTELRTKHTLVAMVTTTVCNHFIAHRLEGI